MDLGQDLYTQKMAESFELRKDAEEYRSKGDYERAWELEASADRMEDEADHDE